MAPPSRFGASKYRNSILFTPPRTEWNRTSLPSTASSTSTSALSTFSSEIKANREYVVTLTPGGELSCRRYGTLGSGDGVEVVKSLGGGPVGDWDLSKLEDGLMVVGGVDGRISVHDISSPSNPLFTISSTSAITNLSLHPTTPSILLSSSQAFPAAIYDISASSQAPVLELNANDETKGMWSVGWSYNGRLVAGVGKKGNGYVWDARAGRDAIMTRMLPIQAIKPTRLVWVGDDIFLTSFTKTRDRQYALFSTKSSLSTTSTQTIDQNNSILVPVVDHERFIVYTAGRGDMTLRQIELSGPQGFQETLHPLPHALSSASLALCHPSTLPVMSAQIATLLLPVVDKDGDAILPLGIRIPRRQLIDFHDDLYPDLMGTVPEQDSKQWLEGGDKKPSGISLNPSKRGVWEKELGKRKAAEPTTTTLRAETTETKVESGKVASPPVPPNTNPPPVQEAKTAIELKQSMVPLPTAAVTAPNPDLPPLQAGEDLSSTSYKVRIIGEHIIGQLQIHKDGGSNGPIMVGLQGPQGCGKTTLSDSLLEYLQSTPRDLRVAVLSLDDFYKTRQGLLEVAAKHPSNPLLSGRGPPGTHDVELATATIQKVKNINEAPDTTVNLPIFDKSLFQGQGDRSNSTREITSPLDVFILEGWSLGFLPISPQDLQSLSSSPYSSKQSLESLTEINDYLRTFTDAVLPPFESMISIQPTSLDNVFQWRLEQEHSMKAKNGGKGMTDEAVNEFVERYMPGYELFTGTMDRDDAPWSGQLLKLVYGEKREVVKIEKPLGIRKSRQPSAGIPINTRNSTQAVSAPTPAVVARTSKPATSSTTPALTQTEPKPAASAPTSTSPFTQAKPFNPGWSRKFLSAKSPLIPSYDSLPPLSSLHQDSQIVKVNSKLVFFPIEGPGGRLAVHPLAKKGRMVVGGEGYLSGGTELADYDVEMFGERVVLAGQDGKIRIWSVGEEGIHGIGPPAEMVMTGKGMDKIIQVVFHPTAKGLLVAASNDFGKPALRFWDLSDGQDRSHIAIEAPGIFNFCFSPYGDRVAISTVDRRILVLDPRDPSSLKAGKAHDSPRSFQLAWIDATHLVSIGFSSGSMRKIVLYEITNTIQTISSLSIDVSPSVLFPVYDPDTSILHVWGKGERQIMAFQVDLQNKAEPLAKLPSYTSGNPQLGVRFLQKKAVDVRKVEIGRCLRLTAKTLEEVSFTIPRNKPEFFQDDIYGSTIDVSVPSTTAAKWLEGDNTAPVRIDLKPKDMISLSQAPQTTSSAKAKFVPAKDVMSEEEKKKQEMDALFQKAKLGDSDSEEEEEKHGIDAPDDDW
ncbi:coronin-7, partial [Tremellales sp. Uapishka_1]